jgi:hypothetical protein
VLPTVWPSASSNSNKYHGTFVSEQKHSLLFLTYHALYASHNEIIT